MRKFILQVVIYNFTLSLIFIKVTGYNYSIMHLISACTLSSIVCFVTLALGQRFKAIFYILFSVLYLIVYISQMLNYTIKGVFLNSSEFGRVQELLSVWRVVHDNIDISVIFVFVLFGVNIYMFLRLKIPQIKVKSIYSAVLIIVLILNSFVMFSIDSLLFKSAYDSNLYIYKFGLENYFIRELIPFSKFDVEATGTDMLKPIEDFSPVENELLGYYEDKTEVVFINAESLHSSAIDEEITPNLYNMRDVGMYFENYYTVTIGTEWSEYASLTSLLPPNVGSVSTYKNDYDSIPKLFEENGYCTTAIHGNDSDYYNRENVYSNVYEFQNIIFSEELDLEGYTLDNPPPDNLVFDRSIEYIEALDCEKNFNYYMTISGHGPYYPSRDDIAENLETFDHREDKYMYNEYLAANINLDMMISEVEAYYDSIGKLDKLLIVLVSDHQPYTILDVNTAEFFIEDYENEGFLSEYNVPFVIYDPTTSSSNNFKYMSNVDILPSLMHLYNFEYEYTMGNNVFDDKYEGHVYWYNNLGYAMLSDEVYYTYGIELERREEEEIRRTVEEQKLFIAEYMQLYK